MKIEIIKEKLLKALGTVERFSGKHISLPVLSFVLLEAKNDMVFLRATNLEIGIELQVGAKVIEPGVVALSPHVIKSFLLSAGVDKVVVIELIEGSITLSSGKTKILIKTNPTDDFPVIPKVIEGSVFSIKTKELVSGISSVWWAAAVSSIKPELSSVYIYEDSGDLVFVATDSFRLAEKRVVTKKTGNFKDLLIPFKNIGEINRTLQEVDEEVDCFVSPNQISIIGTDFHITSRLVEGNFPDYKQIIPKEFSTKMVILKNDLVNSLKLASVFSDKFNQVVFGIIPKDKELEVKTKNIELGESAQILKGSFEGKELSVTFNYKYITDVLGVIEGESVDFSFVGVGKPMIVKTPQYKGFLYLVMPMNR